ncbi:MAG: hypothetical protein NVS9B11_08400 [Candidatus Dormibacteraceae bacterium]
MSARLSPDGMYYWDGQQWVSTLSHDGKTRWNGSAWVPAGAMSGPPMYQQPGPPSTRVATSWTRPLQFAVAGWYALSGLYALSIPFWMGGMVNQVMSDSMQRQRQLNPNVSPPPAEVTNMVTSMMTVGLWIGTFVALAVCVVVVVGALKRWTWMYYVVLVLGGLGTLSAALNLVSAATGSPMNGASGFNTPSWLYALSAAVAIPTAALFVWMLVALMQRGPWGMTRIAAGGASAE